MRITTNAVDSCLANVVQINGNCNSSPRMFKRWIMLYPLDHGYITFQVKKAINFSFYLSRGQWFSGG